MISMLFGTALATQAQQVTLVTPSSMQFSDSAYRVTFRYPAKWNYSRRRICIRESAGNISGRMPEACIARW
jgi:hypothetical protein